MQTKVLVILSIFRYVHASILTFSWAAFSNLPICLHKYIEIFGNITTLSNLFCCLVDHWVAMVSVYIVSSKQNVEGCRYDLYSLGWYYLTAWIRKLYYELQALKRIAMIQLIILIIAVKTASFPATQLHLLGLGLWFGRLPSYLSACFFFQCKFC